MPFGSKTGSMKKGREFCKLVKQSDLNIYSVAIQFLVFLTFSFFIYKSFNRFSVFFIYFWVTMFWFDWYNILGAVTIELVSFPLEWILFRNALSRQTMTDIPRLRVFICDSSEELFDKWPTYEVIFTLELFCYYRL